MQNQYINVYKIILLGDSNAGKSNIALRFAKNQFNDQIKPTIGIQSLSLIITVNNEKTKILLWDTLGQEKFRSLNRQYIRDALGIILVYDVTSLKSYQNLKMWMNYIGMFKDDIVEEQVNLHDIKLIILGNKIDLVNERKISCQQAKSEIESNYDLSYFEVSAKQNENIKQSIMFLINEISNMTITPSSPRKLGKPFKNVIDSVAIYKKNGKVQLTEQKKFCCN